MSIRVVTSTDSYEGDALTISEVGRFHLRSHGRFSLLPVNVEHLARDNEAELSALSIESAAPLELHHWRASPTDSQGRLFAGDLENRRFFFANSNGRLRLYLGSQEREGLRVPLASADRGGWQSTAASASTPLLFGSPAVIATILGLTMPRPGPRSRLSALSLPDPLRALHSFEGLTTPTERAMMRS